MLRLKHLSAFLLLAALSLPAVAADFTAYEGKNAIQEGDGGEKKTVDGVDFWSNGAPPRKFKLLGYLNDRRHKTGLVGKVRMSGLESDIAEEAKKAGGDAVILVGAEAETTGYVGQAQTNTQANARVSGNNVYGNSNAWTNTQAVAVQKQNSRYAVIKYLPDEPAAATEAPAETPEAAQ